MRAFGNNVIYITGNCVELGNWDKEKAIGAFFNTTGSIAEYPDWFLDVSITVGTVIEFKFIIKDAGGNVIRESTVITYITPTDSTDEVSYYFSGRFIVKG